MIPDRYFAPKKLILLATLFIFFSVNTDAQDGKAIFQTKCASCHSMGKDATGPNLQGVVSKWGTNAVHLKEWVLNSTQLAKTNPYAGEVAATRQAVMTPFVGQITDAEIDAVIKYVDEWQPPVVDKTQTTDDKSSGNGGIIFGIISLIMAIIALILMQVNSNLKKLSDDAEGIGRPEPVPFYKNKVYIAFFAIVLFVVGGYFTASGLIDYGRQKNYQPEQPIYYSHKVHAGVNQINCLYCHNSAMDSKHATIPSVNVCMNCHKTISTYEKGPRLFREDGTEVNGTREIEKLYSYAGFDPKNAAAWDPSKAKPIQWTKIHNLPDHVYFNHSQHIKAGKVQCQSCHGEITEMDEVYQFSELSMGWCINCHRDTKVDFYKVDSSGKSTGNKFYSIYEKFHNDIKSGKMDSVTVKDIGGLECQKCHY
jgi:mono/diheme cytochrome c family protein